MVLFVTFILSGLTLGVGTMLAPALPTSHPRIAVSAVLVLAFVLSGSIFLGAWFGWDTLIVDYLWFALIIGVFLGGTLTIGMHRIEEALARGETAQAGWPGPRTLGAFLGWLVALLFIVNTIPTPAAYQALAPTVDFETPDLGAVVLITYFDSQLSANRDHVFHGVLAMITLLLTWLLYDIGNELEDRQRIGWGLTLVAPLVLAGFDLGVLLALTFSLGFGFFAWHWCRDGQRFEALAASICGAAAILSYPYAVSVLVGGYLLLGTFSPIQRWGVGLISISTLMVVGLLPWLAANA